MQNWYEFKVVGMTFLHQLPYGAAYPDDFFAMQEALEQVKAASLGWGNAVVPAGLDPERALLYRNPENEYDANAIEVHVPSLGRRSMIGHVPRDLAAEIAPSMDDGDKWSARLTAVLVEPGKEENPGALILAERVSAYQTAQTNA